MTPVEGTYKDGRIWLDGPTDWPEGCRVLIEPMPAPERIGTNEEDWADTPEAIEDWIRWYDTLEPLVLTPEEEAEWRTARKAQKEYEIARFEDRANRLERLFP
jgi:hypothetical protein